MAKERLDQYYKYELASRKRSFDRTLRNKTKRRTAKYRSAMNKIDQQDLKEREYEGP